MPSALIVDDDRATRSAMTERLEQDAFRVVCCDTLATAREQVAANRFDLILADLQLPDGDGLTLLEDLEPQAHTEVIFITGHASVDSAVEAFRGGAIDYLTKPVDLRRLAKIIDNV